MISPELLRRFALLGGLPPEMYEAIAQFSHELTLEIDTYLFEQNRPANEVFLVLDGTVDLLMNMDEKGRHREEVETLVPGEFIGWSALIEPHEYKLSAVTAEDTHLIVIEAVKFLDLLEQNPDWGYLVMQRIAGIIGERLTHMRMRLMSFHA